MTDIHGKRASSSRGKMWLVLTQRRKLTTLCATVISVPRRAYDILLSEIFGVSVFDDRRRSLSHSPFFFLTLASLIFIVKRERGYYASAFCDRRPSEPFVLSSTASDDKKFVKANIYSLIHRESLAIRTAPHCILTVYIKMLPRWQNKCTKINENPDRRVRHIYIK